MSGFYMRRLVVAIFGLCIGGFEKCTCSYVRILAAVQVPVYLCLCVVGIRIVVEGNGKNREILRVYIKPTYSRAASSSPTQRSRARAPTERRSRSTERERRGWPIRSRAAGNGRS